MNGCGTCPNAHFVDRIPNICWHFSWFCLVLPGKKRVSNSDQQRFLSNPYHLFIHHSLYHSTLYSLGTASLNNLNSICKYRMTKYMESGPDELHTSGTAGSHSDVCSWNTNMFELHTSGTAGSHSDVCSWNTNMFQLFSTKNVKRTPPWHKSVTLTNATDANRLRLVVVRKNWHHGSRILTQSLAELRNKQNVP
jgi:hypothetical protein